MGGGRKLSDWEKIKAAVENNGNVLTTTMETLRNAHGATKLGVHVRTEISNILAGMGLGHVPEELPSYQHEQVRLYKQGTPVGNLIRTVLWPGEQADRELRAHITKGDPDTLAVIEKIRDLVSD